LVFQLGKGFAFFTAAGTAMGAVFSVAKKILSGEEIQADEVIAGALKAGADDRICSRCRADCCRETRSNSRFGKSFCTNDFKFGVQGSRND